MAFPLPRGIMPSEITFLAEMELVTIMPRQRLEGLELLGVCNSYICTMRHQLTSKRALSNRSSLHAVPPFHFGSPYFSNASAAPISCLRHGYTQNH